MVLEPKSPRNERGLYAELGTILGWMTRQDHAPQKRKLPQQ
jgi:hypothetical protein